MCPQDCNDALVKIRLAFRHVQSELPPEGNVAAAATVTLPEGFRFGDEAADHEVELLLHGGGGVGATFSASMNASAGGFGAAVSDGAFDMMEVDTIGLGSQGAFDYYTGLKPMADVLFPCAKVGHDL